MILKRIFPLVIVFLFTLSSCATKTVVAQNRKPKAVVYVKTTPPKPKVIVIKKCGPNSTWIKGHWKWNGRKYIWINGHCVKKRRGYIWIDGHWKNTPRGWKWIPGHWK
ncbi:MAG TPA: hypothetical protein ENK67_07085 [Flavobacteriia bacterium]|nr:hypothetical protein [Flavobacteriia bacterium]